MYKYARALRPNRKTASKRIKHADLIDLRLYSKELNRLVLLYSDSAISKKSTNK